MDGPIEAGDVVVSRVNGTLDGYVIGTVLSGAAGDLMLSDMVPASGRDMAIWYGYTQRHDDHRVWLFDGSATAYVKTMDPTVLETKP